MGDDTPTHDSQFMNYREEEEIKKMKFEKKLPPFIQGSLRVDEGVLFYHFPLSLSIYIYSQGSQVRRKLFN